MYSPSSVELSSSSNHLSLSSPHSLYQHCNFDVFRLHPPNDPSLPRDLLSIGVGHSNRLELACSLDHRSDARLVDLAEHAGDVLAGMCQDCLDTGGLHTNRACGERRSAHVGWSAVLALASQARGSTHVFGEPGGDIVNCAVDDQLAAVGRGVRLHLGGQELGGPEGEREGGRWRGTDVELRPSGGAVSFR